MRMFVFGLVALIMGLSFTSTLGEAKTITVQSAIYYAGKASCNYTKKAKRACGGKLFCLAKCTNEDACGDIKKGVPKQCVIKYRCTGESRVRSGKSWEGTPTKLQCPSG